MYSKKGLGKISLQPLNLQRLYHLPHKKKNVPKP